MKRTTKPRGFTLVELLVVISIIGMLAALLLPAVNAAREAARRSVCNSQQRQIALAVLAFETNRGRFPGFQEQIVSTPSARLGTWLMMIMPNMDRQDVYDLWADPNNTTNFPTPYMKVLRCPSNPPIDTTLPQISYVANAGWAYYAVQTDTQALIDEANLPENGVFVDKWQFPGKKVTMSSLKDGPSNTLIVSENLLAGQWNTGGKLETVFCWNKNSEAVSPAPTARMKINGDKNVLVYPTDLTTETCRPSSSHPGGVIVAFADGHTTFLRDNLNYDVYVQLMTPFHAKSTAIYKGYTLADKDYE